MVPKTLLSASLAALLMLPTLTAQEASKSAPCCGSGATATTTVAAIPSAPPAPAASPSAIGIVRQEAPVPSKPAKAATVTVTTSCEGGACAAPASGSVAAPAPTVASSAFAVRLVTEENPTEGSAPFVKTYRIDGDAPPVASEGSDSRTVIVQEVEGCEGCDEGDNGASTVTEFGELLDLGAAMVWVAENGTLTEVEGFNENAFVIEANPQEAKKECDGCCCCLGQEDSHRGRVMRRIVQGRPGLRGAMLRRSRPQGDARGQVFQHVLPRLGITGPKGQGGGQQNIEVWVDGKRVWTSKAGAGAQAEAGRRRLEATLKEARSPEGSGGSAKPAHPPTRIFENAPRLRAAPAQKPAMPKAPRAVTPPKANVPSKGEGGKNAPSRSTDELKALRKQLQKLEEQMKKLQKELQDQPARGQQRML